MCRSTSVCFLSWLRNSKVRIPFPSSPLFCAQTQQTTKVPQMCRFQPFFGFHRLLWCKICLCLLSQTDLLLSLSQMATRLKTLYYTGKAMGMPSRGLRSCTFLSSASWGKQWLAKRCSSTQVGLIFSPISSLFCTLVNSWTSLCL